MSGVLRSPAMVTLRRMQMAIAQPNGGARGKRLHSRRPWARGREDQDPSVSPLPLSLSNPAILARGLRRACRPTQIPRAENTSHPPRVFATLAKANGPPSTSSGGASEACGAFQYPKNGTATYEFPEGRRPLGCNRAREPLRQATCGSPHLCLLRIHLTRPRRKGGDPRRDARTR